MMLPFLIPEGNVIKLRNQYAGLKFVNVLYLLFEWGFFLSRSNFRPFLIGINSFLKKSCNICKIVFGSCYKNRTVSLTWLSKKSSISTLSVFLQSFVISSTSLSNGSFLLRTKSFGEQRKWLNKSLLVDTMETNSFNSRMSFTFVSNMGLQLVLRFDTSKL